MAVPRQQRRILWIAKHITPSTLQDIALRYQMPLRADGHRGRSRRRPRSTSTTPRAISQAPSPGLPERPGDLAFRHAAVIVFAIYFGIGVLLVLGMGALRRAMVRRAAKIETAVRRADPDRRHCRRRGGATRCRAPAEMESAYSAIDGVISLRVHRRLSTHPRSSVRNHDRCRDAAALDQPTCRRCCRRS